MGDLTQNLSRSEFACQCGCGFDTVDFDLALVLQSTQRYFQALNPGMDIRIKITSGCRCPKHNAKVGGSSNSQHIFGRAADFHLYNRKTGVRLRATDVAEYLEDRYPDSKGIGRYHNRIHVDTRLNKARWDNS